MHAHTHTAGFNPKLTPPPPPCSMSAVCSRRNTTNMQHVCYRIPHTGPSIPLFTLRRIWQRHLNDTAIMVMRAERCLPQNCHAGAAADRGKKGRFKKKMGTTPPPPRPPLLFLCEQLSDGGDPQTETVIEAGEGGGERCRCEAPP